MSQRLYPSDLRDEEWAVIAPLVPPAKPGGHPRRVDMRAVLNALFSPQRTGCQWRALPREYPPWSTVWTYFRQLRNNGTWETALREASRRHRGRRSASHNAR